MSDRPASLRPVLVVAVLLAACSMLYELLAAQTLSLLAASTVVWYSLVVGFFLASMGIGALLAGRFVGGDPWRPLFRLEMALTVLGGLTVPLLRIGHTAFLHLDALERTGPGLLAFLGTALVVVCSLGALTGAELPLLMRAARRVRDDGRAGNLVLGWDYLGSLLGALAFPLVVLPNLGLLAAGLVVALLNLGVAAWILEYRLGREARRAEMAAAGAAAALVLLGLAQADRVEQYFLRRYYYRHDMAAGWTGRFAPRPDLPRVGHVRSPYQVIDLVADVSPDFMAGLMPCYSTKLEHEPDFPLDRVLFLEGDFQTNTRFEEVYHEWFAHVPVIATGKVPGNVLLLGGGDGFLLREILQYGGVRRVRHVDLDRTLVDLARSQPVLRAANHDAFLDPRVETTFEDGYQFLRRGREKFDAIYIDFPVALTYDLAKLYSREFFEFVRRSIAPGGFAVFDSTGTSLFTPRDAAGNRRMSAQNDWPVYANTLLAAGFPTIVPYLTTLERDNPAVEERAQALGLDASVERRIARIRDPEERAHWREKLRDSLASRLQEIQSVGLEQGFILLAPERREVRRTFEDPGVRLYVLDARRYAMAFETGLPLPGRVDPSKVNSILRPTLPTAPWWRPRVGY